MKIGLRIKKIREEKNISQTELAEKIGVSKQNLYKYETGIITNIPSDKIEAIAKVCDVTPALIMGWEENVPAVTDDYVTFPVIGEIAAGYDSIGIEDWGGDTIDIPCSYLKGHKKEEFFVLSVKGNSMYPLYQEGDKVLILKCTALNYSGQIGAVLYDDELTTIKKVEFATGENWLRLVPINPEYPPKKIEDEALEHCKIIGTPKLLIREIRE